MDKPVSVRTAHTVQQLEGNSGINVLPPVFPICRHRNFPVGPLAGEVDTHTGHNRWAVLKAERGQVQTVRQDTPKRKQAETEQRQEKRLLVYL